jgi:hypothetical protein
MTSSSNNILHKRLDEIPPVPPPVSTNMVMVSSPATSIHKGLSSNDSFDDFEQVKNKKKQKRKRRPAASTHSSAVVVSPPVIPTDPVIVMPVSQNLGQQVHASQVMHGPQQISITNESTRYAQTRYPFPPFSIRFNTGKVSSNHVKEGLIDYCKKEHQMEINIMNCRLANGSSNNGYDILVFVSNASSFSFLLDQNHWPNVFNNETYTFPYFPSIPPQLSLLVKNVDLHLDFNEFCLDVKTRYPQIKNVIRMKNKFQNNIKLVKLEFTSSKVREELLNGRKIIIDYVAYDIEEYLAPANVLICSKCMGIGHFKKQCTQVKDTCHTCGDLVEDLKLHNCSKIEKCIHCGQNHKSNSLKCQVVKSFRAELTRKLLSSNNRSNSSVTNTSNNYGNLNFTYNKSNFPELLAPQFIQSNSMIIKLDDLLEKMSEVNTHLSNLKLKYDKFEQFMMEKNESDSMIKDNLNLLSKQSSELKTGVTQHSLLIQRHDNIFVKLIIPMFEDLFGLISKQNQDRKGNPLDADLKLKLERYLIQMKNAKEGKHFSS